MSNSPQTVVVTGANSRTGRDLLTRFADQGVRVVALVRSKDALPADEVIDDWMNSPRAAEALRDASAVVHLSGVFAADDWAGYKAGTVATARRVVETVNSKARLVYLSYVGADSTDANWYTKAKGQAEEALRTVTGSVIFRIDALAGGRDNPAPFELMFRQTAPDAPVRIIGDGTQRFRPIYSADAVDALAKAALGHGAPGTYDLVGPREFVVADLPELINGHPVPVTHVSAQQAATVPGPPKTVVDLLANHPTPPGPDAVIEAFELSLTSLETTWPIAAPRP
ncbi:SDR family oxidoreductase [Streptomyces sp. OE57]|uniref:SDR family oxidoreductase n=1 Tax=Streptomyces lacaronensis TaxID=3379885 RepID=UPI0039B7482F